MRQVPTAPIVAASFVGSWAAVEASGSRPLGGAVLAVGGLSCIALWNRRHGPRTAATLGAAGFLGFVVSHLIGLLIGAWPAVLVTAAAVSLLAWVKADALDRAALLRRPAR